MNVTNMPASDMNCCCCNIVDAMGRQQWYSRYSLAADLAEHLFARALACNASVSAVGLGQVFVEE